VNAERLGAAITRDTGTSAASAAFSGGGRYGIETGRRGGGRSRPRRARRGRSTWRRLAGLENGLARVSRRPVNSAAQRREAGMSCPAPHTIDAIIDALG
jgi:hypothetical protein